MGHRRPRRARRRDWRPGCWPASATRRKKSDERVAAARELIEFRPGDDEAALKLLDQIGPRGTPELTAGLLRALRPEREQQLAAHSSSGWPAGRRRLARPLSVAAVVAGRLDRIAARRPPRGARLPLTELALDQRQALATHPNAQLAGRARELLAQAGGLPDRRSAESAGAAVAAGQLEGRRGERARRCSRKRVPSATSTAARGRRSGPT